MTKVLTVDEKLRKLVHGTRDTLGLKLYNHLEKEQKQPEWTDLEEIAPIRDANYLEEVTNVANAEEHKYDGDYFVVTVVRREPLLNNHRRKQTFTRKSCPTPTHDQIVWKVHKNDRLEFIWSVPSKTSSELLMMNRQKVPPRNYPSLQQAIEFFDGTLDRKCSELNGEHVNSPYLIKNPIYTSTGAVWKNN